MLTLIWNVFAIIGLISVLLSVVIAAVLIRNSRRGDSE